MDGTASWETMGGDLSCPPSLNAGSGSTPYLAGGKRRVSQIGEWDIFPDCDTPQPKRLRSGSAVGSSISLDINGLPSLHSTHAPREILFLQRGASPFPSDGRTSPRPCEFTASGYTIASRICSVSDIEDDLDLIEDLDAAAQVRESLQRRARGTHHERILRSLIEPKSREAEFSIDDTALESIFSAANELFFSGRLRQRVAWDWSHCSSPQYRDHIIGSTALRRSRLGGYETLVVLSRPILTDPIYNRRLLISTFLHELIHSYLFICCGLKARYCSGHTAGFREITVIIDSWAGANKLHLREIEADLNRFRDSQESGEDHDAGDKHYHLHRPHSPPQWIHDDCRLLVEEEAQSHDHHSHARHVYEKPRIRHHNPSPDTQSIDHPRHPSFAPHYEHHCHRIVPNPCTDVLPQVSAGERTTIHYCHRPYSPIDEYLESTEHRRHVFYADRYEPLPPQMLESRNPDSSMAPSNPASHYSDPTFTRHQSWRFYEEQIEGGGLRSHRAAVSMTSGAEYVIARQSTGV